jgi:hypothetical protein
VGRPDPASGMAGGSSWTTIAERRDVFLSGVRGRRTTHERQGEGLMAGQVTQEYDAVLNAARRLAPAEQLRLAQELVSDNQILALWEEWQRRLAEHGDVASDEEIDAIVAQVRAERRCGKR